MNKQHTKQWFRNRIGKRIFRDATSCRCQSCKDVVENGLIIFDGSEHGNKYMHADYVFDCQNEMLIFYRDKK